MDQIEYFHESVLPKEVLEGLNPEEGQKFIDGTLGGGGHTGLMLKKVGTSGEMMAMDLDKNALDLAKKNFENNKNLILKHGNFSQMKKVTDEIGWTGKVNGILLDLGVSSFQLDNKELGFSFDSENTLDMRLNQEEGISALEVVNTYSKKDLGYIFKRFGEESFYKKVAEEIVRRREEKEITSGKELATLVKEAIPKKYWGKTHPATKIFQAIRIEVNKELEHLEIFLENFLEILAPGGRLAIISFHSLEDRIVKHDFRNKAQSCICPKEFPICNCNNKAKIKILTKKAISPSDQEIEKNPRSRSAKLRICEKI